MRFVDSNVLIYLVSTDPAESAKRAVALDLLNDSDLCLSTQVLGEFYVQATRGSRAKPLGHSDAVALLESFGRYPVQPVTHAVVKSALATRARFGVSYWDAAIVEAARAAGAEVVLSEDLQNGQDFAGVLIANPFQCSGRKRSNSLL